MSCGRFAVIEPSADSDLIGDSDPYDRAILTDAPLWVVVVLLGAN